MNRTLFQICIVMCLGLIIFGLGISYLQSINAFDSVSDAGINTTTGEALEDLSDLDEPNMGYIFGIILGSAGAGLVVGWLTHSIVPFGISIFSGVFWASFVNTHMILSTGGYIPGEILGIVTISATFVFIGAVVGMATGSG